ncbi:MAG TPA: hypothetical protein VMV62_02355 [Candidatus Paceibacterota bacterium]|nr:hypothetical protein [Candidatus Paceibacterota bacterium]
MKNLFWGILLIILVGVGGLVYRNAVEHPSQPIACPLDAEVCPDGTSVARTGLSCTFPACPPPNVSLADANIAFAIPPGFSVAEVPDAASIAAYGESATSSVTTANIIIRRYTVDASSTPDSIIHQTALDGVSGTPVGVTAFTSSVLGRNRFTIVSIERSEGTIDTAYYPVNLPSGTGVLRFDAVDTGVANWADPALDISALPAHAALAKLLSTLQVL